MDDARPRTPILTVRAARLGIHVIVPALHRIVPDTMPETDPIPAHWHGGHLVLSLPLRPILLMTGPQRWVLASYIGAESAPILLTDHNRRYRTWIGPVEPPDVAERTGA